MIFAKNDVIDAGIKSDSNDMQVLNQGGVPTGLIGGVMYLVIHNQDPAAVELLERIVASDGVDGITADIKQVIRGLFRSRGIVLSSSIAQADSPVVAAPSTSPSISQPTSPARDVSAVSRSTSPTATPQPRTPAPVTDINTTQDVDELLSRIKDPATAPHERDEIARKIRDIAYQRKDQQTIDAVATLIRSPLIKADRKCDLNNNLDLSNQSAKLIDALLYLAVTQKKQEALDHLVEIIQTDNIPGITNEVKLRIIEVFEKNQRTPMFKEALKKLIPDFKIFLKMGGNIGEAALRILKQLAIEKEPQAFESILEVTLDDSLQDNQWRDTMVIEIRKIAYERKDKQTIDALAMLIRSPKVKADRKCDLNINLDLNNQPIKLIDALLYLAVTQKKKEALDHLVEIIQTDNISGITNEVKLRIIEVLEKNQRTPMFKEALKKLIPNFKIFLKMMGGIGEAALRILKQLAIEKEPQAFESILEITLDDSLNDNDWRDTMVIEIRKIAYERKDKQTIDALNTLIRSPLIKVDRKCDLTINLDLNNQPIKLIDALLYLAVTQKKQEALDHLISIVRSRDQIKGVDEKVKERIVTELTKINDPSKELLSALMSILADDTVSSELRLPCVRTLHKVYSRNPKQLTLGLYFMVYDNYSTDKHDISVGLYSAEVLARYNQMEQQGELELRRMLIDRNFTAVKAALAQNRFTPEAVAQAILLNNLNNIVVQTTGLIEDVKKADVKNRKGLMDGMVSIRDKLQGIVRPFSLTDWESSLTSCGISGLNLNQFGFRSVGNGVIIPTVFDVLLSTYRGSAEVDSIHNTYLTHAITTAIIHYANKGGENARSDGAEGFNAFHEFDQGALNLLGENNRRKDDHVTLAFSYPNDKPMPEYTRKRTMLLRDRTIMEILLQLGQWQAKERKAKQNIFKLLKLLTEGKVAKQKLDELINVFKAQLDILRSQCGLNKAYFDFLFGYINDSFFDNLRKAYQPQRDNGEILHRLLQSAMTGFHVVKKSPRQGIREVTDKHSWIDSHIMLGRKHRAPLTLLTYLGNEEYIRKYTYDDVDLSDKMDFSVPVVAVPAVATLARAPLVGPDLAAATVAAQPNADKTIDLFFAGRVTEDKGASDFLLVLSDIQAKYKANGITVRGHFLGAVEDSFKQQLQNLAFANNITHLEFHGPYSPEDFVLTLNRLNRPNCIFVHTLGLVTKEVMAMGFPIVSRDTMADRGTYKVAENQYRQAIEDLIDHPEKREALTAYARQEAERLYGSRQWLQTMFDVVERVTGRKVNDRFRASFSFSGFGYGKHGVNEYYNKFFRYLAKLQGVQSEVAVVSMQQRQFMQAQFPSSMFVDGVFEQSQLQEVNTYQHIGTHKKGTVPSDAVIRQQFLPALTRLIKAIQSVDLDAKNIFKVTNQSSQMTQEALEAMVQMQEYFVKGGYDVEKTMLHPLVEEVMKNIFPGSDGKFKGLQANMVSFDKRDKPLDHFSKLITLMYMLAQPMPDGKDVSFTMQLFPPILDIVHHRQGGPPVIYVEHTRLGYNERAVIKSIDDGKYPGHVKQFMKQYVALMKMIMVHHVDGYINPWDGNAMTETYGGFFRGQSFYLPHAVDTEFYQYASSGQTNTAIAESSAQDFISVKDGLVPQTDERTQRAELLGIVQSSLTTSVGSRGRVLAQGSVGRNTDLPGKFDLDLLGVFKNSFNPTQEGEKIIAALKSKFEERGYTINNIKQRPHNSHQWLISFIVYEKSGRPLTKVEITLRQEGKVYPDLFNAQMNQIQEQFSLAGQEATLSDIRFMKHLLQEGIESYKWFHGGLSGIGAEQLIIQSGGVEQNGWKINGQGSFAKAMKLIYSIGYDQQNKTIRPVSEVINSFQIYNMDGSNLMQSLNDWSWRRLVHAARVYTEGKAQGTTFSDPEALRYNLSDAIKYRKGFFRGYELEMENHIGDSLANSSFVFERVGANRYYVFVTDQAEARRFEQGEFSQSIKNTADQALLTKAGSAAIDEATGTAPVGADIDRKGGIDFDINKIDLFIQNDGAPIQFEFDPAQLKDFEVDGFTPLIIKIEPIPSLPLFLGSLNPEEQQTALIN